MTINILDKDVVKQYNDDMQKHVDGVMLKIYNSDGDGLYGGVVWPNEQYEYDAEKGGEYKICIDFTDSMFEKTGYKQIKT